MTRKLDVRQRTELPVDSRSFTLKIYRDMFAQTIACNTLHEPRDTMCHIEL